MSSYRLHRSSCNVPVILCQILIKLEFSGQIFEKYANIKFRRIFIHLPIKMEPIVSSETSAIRTQTPGNYPKRNKLHLEHGESLKTRFVESRKLSTNKCTYINFHIKTLKIAPTCFDPKIILRELRCSLLKSF